VQVLSLRYLGGGCAAGTNPQGGKATCRDYGSATEPVRIRVTSADGKKVFLDTGLPAGVHFGAVVEAKASNAGASTLPASVVIKIYNAAGAVIEELTVQTDCSKPLNLGDRFGNLQVFGMDTVDSTDPLPVALGAEVTFWYSINNIGGLSAANVVVMDNYGNVDNSPIPMLPAGGSSVLTRSVILDAGTLNNVTASSSSGCAASDAVQVIK
jgi:hypothetical protein